ncbi:hypothetical protein BDQ17DRAFT_1435410 [Cyathus striatus]|nr:hypothetical protein BDQ17DRAFT_1435410 [Cyathus striatus]
MGSWTIYKPSDILLDEGAEHMPKTVFLRGATGKLPSLLLENLCNYIAACRATDAILRLKGAAYIQMEEVLCHKNQKVWVGQQNNLEALSNLQDMLVAFVSYGDYIIQLISNRLISKEPDVSVRLANEIAEMKGGKKALTIVKNLASVAFCLAVMIKGEGCLQVPESCTDLGLSEDLEVTEAVDQLLHNPQRLKNLNSLLSNFKELRHFLQLIALISPLLAIVPKELIKTCFCYEKLVLNMKLIGNQWPPLVKTLEDDIWLGILGIVEGTSTAFSTFLDLHTKWKGYIQSNSLDESQVEYFARKSVFKFGASIFILSILFPVIEALLEYNEDKYGTSMSIFTSYVDLPAPTNWPLPVAATEHLSAGWGKSKPRSVPSESSAAVEAPAPKAPLRQSERVQRRAPQPPKATVASKANYSSRKSKVKLQLNPSKPKRAAPSLGQDDLEFQPEEFLTYSNLLSKNALERQKIEDELATMLETSKDQESFEEKPTLTLELLTEKYSDSQNDKLVLWSASRRSDCYKLSCHTKDNHKSWLLMYQSAIKIYSDIKESGIYRPLFVDNPSNSLLRHVLWNDFDNMSTQEVQAMLQTQNIVIEGSKEKKDLNDPVDIHDQSIEVSEDDGDFQECIVTGSLMDLLKSSAAFPGKKKSLNGLSFPAPHTAVEASSYASDVPATEGASHFWHIDSRGDGTMVHVAAGLKLWAVAEPHDPDLLSSTTVWTDPSFGVRYLDPSKWKIEMVVLKPGDTLLMRPCTPHVVYTLDDTICHGGHYIPISCISRVICGSIHGFFAGYIITNADNPSFQSRMNLIACFLYKTLGSSNMQAQDKGHLLNIETESGLKDLMFFACYIELQNALCTSSYLPTNDQVLINKLLFNRLGSGDESPEDEMEILLHKVSKRFSIILEGEAEAWDPWNALFIPMLAWLIHSLNFYHLGSLDLRESGIIGNRFATLFECQLEWISECWPELEAELEHMKRKGIVAQNLMWSAPKFKILLNAPNIGPNQDSAKEVVEEPSDLYCHERRAGDLLYLSVYTAKLSKHCFPNEIPSQQESAKCSRQS